MPSDRSGSKTKGNSGKGAPNPRNATLVSENNIDEVENETIERVNKTISVLENSIAIWDAAKEKPAELQEEFDRFKKFYSALTQWETKALRIKQKVPDFAVRVNMLKEFTDICQMYA